MQQSYETKLDELLTWLPEHHYDAPINITNRA
jgi:hypothetical protein